MTPLPLAVLLRRAGLGISLVTVLIGSGLDAQRTWAAVLLWSLLLVTLGLAGALFLAIQYGHRAAGSDTLRASCERLVGALAPGAVGVILVLLFHPSLFPGYQLETGHGAAFKGWWLSRGFHFGRSLVYLGVWVWLARALVQVSRSRRAAPTPETIAQHGRLAAVFFYVFAFTLTLAAIDWVMALEPHWYSTIFGLYHFAGLATGGLAAMLVLMLRECPGDDPGFGPARRHDLGQFMMAMCCLWLYLWFSQFLLIWYTAIPEETSYYVVRLSGAWWPFFWLNLALNGVIPFFALLSREAKTSTVALAVVAAVVLVGRWLDLHLMILPGVLPDGPPLNWVELGLATGAVTLTGLFLAGPKPPNREAD